MSLAQLKKSSKSRLESLKKKAEEATTQKKSYSDDRFWVPEKDSEGNFSGIIRFLPATEADGEDQVPWIEWFSHGFKVNGRWYIEDSLTTIGKEDPVSQSNSELWNTGIESNKEIARQRKRRKSFISNILVVKDEKNPENEGKVFLYKYGQKIFDKIKAEMFPDEDLEQEECDVFDFWNGKNFRLKIKKQGEYPNYDDSQFLKVSQIKDDDSEIEEIWGKQHSLKELKDPSNFKSYDELKTRLNQVINGPQGEDTLEQKIEKEEMDIDSQLNALAESTTSETTSDDSSSEDVDVDEFLKQFQE